MEGPAVDWKIEEAESDVEWILEKGLSLGKNVVVTGLVISSAPLILPSIVIVSALGFVVSIPFGLVFASYACSQKLMNILLPVPTTSSMLEHETMAEPQDHEEEEEEEEQDAKGSGAQEVDMEEEEKGGIENSGEGTEKRIESVENESKLPPAKEGDGNDEDVNDQSRDEEERMANEDESVENKGYEEDVGENLQEEDEKRTGEAIDVEIEGVGEGEEAEKGPIEEESKDEEPLPEQEDQKGNAGDAEKNKKKNKGGEEKSQVVEGKDDSTNDGTVKESENPVKNENDNGKTLDQGTTEEENVKNENDNGKTLDQGTTEEENAKEPETNSGGQNANGVETGKSI